MSHRSILDLRVLFDLSAALTGRLVSLVCCPILVWFFWRLAMMLLIVD